MKRLATTTLALALALIPVSSIHAATDTAYKHVRGGFEMNGFLTVGAGFQHFSNAPVTNTQGGASYAGVLGNVLPNTISGVPPILM